MALTPEQIKAGYSTVAGPYDPLTGSPVQSASPSILSTTKGADIIDQAKAREAKLTIPAYGTSVTDSMGRVGTAKFDPKTGQPLQPTETKPAETKPTYKVSMINELGQSINVDNPSQSDYQQYLNSGYALKEASGNPPAWISTATTGGTAPQKSNEQIAVDTAKADKEAAIAKLNNFNVSNDPALTSMLSGISSSWDARIAEMERTNKSREAAITQTGVRLGSRYTGGMGGMTGSLISAEEKDAVARIATLEGQKQSALAEAKNAYETKKWNQYVDLVNVADKTYQEQLSALKELNTAQAAQDKILQEKATKAQEAFTQASRDSAISSLMTQGITDPAQLINYLNFDEQGNQIGDFTAKEIADSIKSLETTEKLAPGVVGEWQAAIKADPTLKGMTLNDYLQFKDPTRALGLRQQELTIKKLEKDLANNGISEDPSNVLAYAQQYATTGAIPPGLPKGTFGVVAQAAKELPKPNGTMVSSITGVRDAKLGTVAQDDFMRLNNIVNNVKRLKELDQKRIGGLVSGSLGKVFGSEDQAKYLATRKSIVDDLARMQSGAALTQDEVAFYEDYLPGRFSEVLGLGQDSLKKIQNFEQIMNNRLKDGLASNSLSIYGYSKVKIGDKEYTVGDTVTNAKGEIGRVLPDGSISMQ